MKRYYGVKGAAAAWILHEELRSKERALVVVSQDKLVAPLIGDLESIGQYQNITPIPSRASLPFEMVSPDLATSTARNRCITSVLNQDEGIYVASLTSLVQKLLPLQAYQDRSLKLSQYQEIEREELYDHLMHFGFLESTNVQEVGEATKRGGVIDLYPAHSKAGVRVEIVGGIIQKIRPFSTATQRSEESELKELTVLPVRERLSWKELLDYSDFDEHEHIRTFKTFAEKRETPLRESTEVLSALKEDLTLPGIEIYQHIMPAQWSSWLDIDIPIILVDELEIYQEADRFDELLLEREERLAEQHYLIPSKQDLFLTSQQITKHLKTNASVSISKINLDASDDDAEKVVNFSLTELSVRLSQGKKEGHHFQPLASMVADWRNQGLRVAFAIGALHRAKRLQRILLDLDFDVPIVTDISISEWAQEHTRVPIAILQGELSEGIQIPDQKIVLISEREIFGETSKPRTEQPVSVKKLLNSLSQLRPGDLVVHVDYGIGKYHGFTHRDVNGCGTDLLQIEYSDSTLFLPMTNIAKVQRYSGVEGQQPALDKLSSQKWQKTKAKVRRSVEILAGDLVKLYAARKIAKGWRFDPAGAQDEEFADGFPFQETVDQLKAIEETLADMANEQPMDRLICGDVGFGKTEVALRAAYKATQHSKQTAILCPTTILVEQHFQTFQNRLSEFPVRVGAVSRFYTAEQNRKTIDTLRTGELDIIIGTHKLLQRDVEFKDLGLLIIDEEHRFGVKQKERLKQYKTLVDVLTLTATPIPRTLHMSLLQLRDISIISSPPTDRRTIRTFVTQSDENTIRDALLRELQRSGQIFFVHNRVKSIDLITEQLRELVPEARILYAHGQMPESQLEDIMNKFLKHEIDILVATTIIESGIDIPNANTMVIDRADTFGLAQLYQLRGRVGRSNKQAYCYFLTPGKKRLSGEAQERLRALQALDDLGIGFQLAVRDLEIRGAGNLLGKEQSGSVLSVGFELYTRILDEAIHHLTGEELSYDVLIEPEVKYEIDAFIPEDYIPDVHERMVIYQRLSSLRSQEDALEIRDEMEDRFGSLAEETEALIALMTFRGQLKRFGVVKCEIRDNRFTCSFANKSPVSTEKALELIEAEPRKYKLGSNDSFTVMSKKFEELSPGRMFEKVLEVLGKLVE